MSFTCFLHYFSLLGSPAVVIKYVTDQLGIVINNSFTLTYLDRERTRREHIQLVRKFLRLNPFSVDCHSLLTDYLVGENLDPGHLPFWTKAAEDFLRIKQFVLPSCKVLRRIVLSARYQSIERVMYEIYEMVGNKQKEQLETLLQKHDQTGTSWNMLVDKNIYTVSSEKIHVVLKNIKKIRTLRLQELDFQDLHLQHIRNFAQQGLHLTAKKLSEYSPARRYTIMVATLKELEGELIDIAIQMNDEILAGVFRRGEKRTKTYLRRNRKLVRQVLTAFRRISDTLLDETLQAAEIVQRIKGSFPKDRLVELKRGAVLLDVPRSQEVLRLASNGYQTIKKYLFEFLDTLSITAFSQNDPIVNAMNYYMTKQQQKARIDSEAPIEFIQEKRWRKVVLNEDGKPRTRPWLLCFSDRLRRSLRQGSLQVEGTNQYKSLQSDFIPWKEWNSIVIKEDHILKYTLSPHQVIAPIGKSIQVLCENFKNWLK
jgi:hypothetical protein